MYFIPRNNKIYDYIASTKPTHRYAFTAITITTTLFISLSCVYYPLRSYNTMLMRMREKLEQKCNELPTLEHQQKNYQQLIDKSEQILAQHKTPEDQKIVQKKLPFLVTALNQAGLTIHSYTVAKEKEKDWYKKEIIHLTASGSFEQCHNFIKQILMQEQLFSIPQLSLICHNARSDLNCDIAYIVMKNPSTQKQAEGLGG